MRAGHVLCVGRRVPIVRTTAQTATRPAPTGTTGRLSGRRTVRRSRSGRRLMAASTLRFALSPADLQRVARLPSPQGVTGSPHSRTSSPPQTHTSPRPTTLLGAGSSPAR